jgi:hypothetical protein
MYHSSETDHRTKDCPIFLESKRKNGARFRKAVAAIRTPRSQPHHAMGSSPPAIFFILSFASSTATLPEHPNPTSGILSILPLCHNQSPATFANSSNNVPPPVPQIAYPPVAPQITYPVPNNTSPQVKTEDNPLPPPPPQIQELRQQNDTFPTHSTIITITGGSNTNFDTKRQHRDYYWEVNHVAIEGPITQTKWSHIPITISAQDVNLVLFPHTDAMVLMVHIDR